MNYNLRDRTTLRLPRRLQASDSSDTSEENREQVDELVENVTSHSNSSGTSVSDETENLAALREELEELETSFFGLVDQEEEDEETTSDENEQAQATMAATTRFELDPYAGDINPAESDGRKLFLAATKEKDDEKKFTVKQDNAKLFMEAMMHDSNKFCWGELVHSVPVARNETLSIFRDIRKLKLDFVLLQAKKTWNSWTTLYSSTVPKESSDFEVINIDPENDVTDKPIFFRRVRSKMIWQRLLGSLSPASENALMARKHLFRWKKPTGDYEYDGPTALFLVLESVNPNTRVGVARLKQKLRETRLGGYNHNVRDMLTAVQSTYTMIEELGFKHDDIVMDVFAALLSTKNQIFKDFIQRKKDAWETGEDMTLGDISEYALNKYNNMVEQKSWQQKESSESKLIALMTDLVNKNGKKPNPERSQNTQSGKTCSTSVESWRMKKKGDTIERDGKTWHWCPDHFLKGVFDGLYMLHKPGAGHQEWLERKNKRKAQKKSGKSGGSNPTSGSTGNSGRNSGNSGNSNSSKLALSDKLKTVLATKLSISESEAMSMVGDICGSLNE